MMDLFSIDLFERSTNLMREAFKLKKYRAFPNKLLAIVVFVIMFPLLSLSICLAATLFVITFILKIIQAPIDYLKSLVNSEGKEVKHATQFIIYFVSWPFIFFYYVTVAFMRVYVYILYAVLSCVTYAWTLGGFKFHLFIDQADDIAIECNGSYKMGLVLSFVIIQAILLILIPVTYGISIYSQLYAAFEEQYFLGYFIPVVCQFNCYSLVFSLIYSYLGFCRFPKVDSKEIAQ